jgi:hypothetical protein
MDPALSFFSCGLSDARERYLRDGQWAGSTSWTVGIWGRTNNWQHPISAICQRVHRFFFFFFFFFFTSLLHSANHKVNHKS